MNSVSSILADISANNQDGGSGTSYPFVARPMLETIEEIKSKLRLIDGETKSFYENSYRYLREAKGEVHQLRERNNELRKKLGRHATTSQSVLDKAFNTKRDQRLLNPNTTDQHVLEIFEDDVAKKMNELNLLKHQSRTKEGYLKKLETELDEWEVKLGQMEEANVGDGPTMQCIRIVENKIEKAKLKYEEMMHIGRTYSAIRDKLHTEGCTYVNTTEALKGEIERCSKKLSELRSIYEDAILVRDRTKTELQRHEELLFAHRKRRELEISSLRRLVDSKKEKPAPQKNAMAEVIGEDVEDETTMEPQSRLSYCNTIYDRLKAITGFSDMDDIVSRFEQQQRNSIHLDELRVQNDNELKRLKHKRQKLKKELEEIRVEYEQKKDKMEEDKEKHMSKIRENQKKLDKLNHELDDQEKAMAYAHIAIEHIFNKLYMVRIAAKRDRAHATTTKEIILDASPVELLRRCLELYDQLKADLDEYDFLDEQERMDEAISKSLRTRDEYRETVDRRLPLHAIRIEPLSKDVGYPDETDVGDQDAPTREAIKLRSKMIVEHAKRKIARNRRGNR
ncbi:unnamed protein product [Calicophoron daubneyi]|uniref:Uncharacterized protein n=1 Tax=Calicophoron daubneyi TaxID=300641 RepID=A0AAV2T3E5_CALDB